MFLLSHSHCKNVQNCLQRPRVGRKRDEAVTLCRTAWKILHTVITFLLPFRMYFSQANCSFMQLSCKSTKLSQKALTLASVAADTGECKGMISLNRHHSNCGYFKSTSNYPKSVHTTPLANGFILQTDSSHPLPFLAIKLIRSPRTIGFFFKLFERPITRAGTWS